MKHLDRMKYDLVNPASDNIKVLQEKKVKETQCVIIDEISMPELPHASTSTMRLPPLPSPASFFASNLIRPQPPNVFSAPLNLIAPPSEQISLTSNPAPVPSKSSMTFEAKPQTRVQQDITKFVPTVLKVKRDGKAINSSNGSVKRPDISGLNPTSRFKDPLSMRVRMGNKSSKTNQHHLTMTGLSAYNTFIKELSQLV